MPALSAATAPGWSPAGSNSETIRNGFCFGGIASGLYRRAVTARPGHSRPSALNPSVAHEAMSRAPTLSRQKCAAPGSHRLEPASALILAFRRHTRPAATEGGSAVPGGAEAEHRPEPDQAEAGDVSATWSERSPRRRPARTTPVVEHREPPDAAAQMPHSSATPSAQPPMTDAVDAAANAVAQEAIVSGFEAVATSEVRSARAGVTTSDGTSSPSRTRCAAEGCARP